MPPSPMFCEFDGCTREPLPYSRFCQFCQRKGALRDYLQQSSIHESAVQARRQDRLAPEPWRVLLAYCEPAQRNGTYTYAVGVHRYVKFGQAHDVEGRLRNLQISSPHRLRVLAKIRSSPELEHHIHSALRAHTYRGGWFSLNETTNEFIRLMKGNDVVGICRKITSLLPQTPGAFHDEKEDMLV